LGAKAWAWERRDVTADAGSTWVSGGSCAIMRNIGVSAGRIQVRGYGMRVYCFSFCAESAGGRWRS
jgi:hypothetical protein